MVNEVKDEPLRRDPSASFTRRRELRAFYSGHSLTDGVADAVATIASSLGDSLQYEEQSIPGSLLRVRTKGNDPTRSDFAGYKLGRNRHGEGLDVQRELSSQRPAADRYRALVVTERHDLPWSAAHESTAVYLAHMVTQLTQGNPDADTFFYHGWLDLDLREPATWLAYERSALRLWECVASAANDELARKKLPARIRVLPGATALAALVEQVVQGRVPGFDTGATEARLKLLFRDNVHLTPLGIYYMGLVHYAVLFGRSPAGAAAPEGLDPASALAMQKLAAQVVQDYAQVADAAAHRDLTACAELAARKLCGALFELRAQTSPQSAFSVVRRMLDIRECASQYAPDNPRNPFVRRTNEAEASH